MLLVGVSISSYRALRGGAYDEYSGRLTASFHTFNSSMYEAQSVGFRVAHIPEPSTLALLVIGAVGLTAFGLLAFGRRR